MAAIATLLSGGECVGVGARAAGLQHIWGFEYDDAIAGVARLNGFDVRTADVMSLDTTTLPIPDVLHASPVCKRASQANQSAELNEDGTKEAPEDLAMGEKIASFIDVMTPRVVTIENVYQYRNFKAFKTICAALDRNGYMWDFDNLNSADFGVPQTRRRLILRAVRGALLPVLPQPVRWVGWHEAIWDLSPQFVPITARWISRFFNPSKESLPVLVDALNVSRPPTILAKDSPAMTVTAHYGTRASHVPTVWGDTKNGRHINARALARLQSIPDSYILPDSNKLACTVIGNGVCPLLYQRIIEQFQL